MEDETSCSKKRKETVEPDPSSTKISKLHKLTSCSPVCSTGIASVLILHLLILGWNGEEKARLEVLPSDSVLVGMRQIQDQVGVPPEQQRLVHGERELVAADLWGSIGLQDWASIQLTVVIDEVGWSCGCSLFLHLWIIYLFHSSLTVATTG